MQPKLVFNMGNRNEDPISVSVYSDAKNGYTFATVYSNKCVSVFLHQTIPELNWIRISTVYNFCSEFQQ